MLSPEVKAARIGKITSSVAAACLGIDDRMSQVDAWLQIMGRAPDLADDPNLRKAIDRGNRLERYILDHPAEIHGLDWTDAPFRQHPDHDWMGDSADALYWTPDPDGKARDPGGPYDGLVMVGEGKSASMGVAKGYGEEGTDDIPAHTLLQSHFHLIHWPEVDRCAVPVLVGGYKFEFLTYYVNRNVEFEGILTQDLERWHRDHVVADNPPPVSAMDTDWLKGKHPEAGGGMVEATEELRELAVKYKAAHGAEKAAKDDKVLAGNQIRQIIGDNDGAAGLWGKVTWRNNAPSTAVGWHDLAIDLFEKLNVPAEEREAFVATHTYEKRGARVLRVNVKKKKGA